MPPIRFQPMPVRMSTLLSHGQQVHLMRGLNVSYPSLLSPSADSLLVSIELLRSINRWRQILGTE
jgi:hypothetical protein